MGNAALLWNNLVDADATTITATSALPTTPAQEFLQDPHVLNRWFSTSTSSASILVDFGADVSLDTIALMGVVGTNPSVRFRLSSTDPTGALGEKYDIGPLAGQFDDDYLALVHLIATVKTGRYLLIDLTSAGSVTIGAGRLAVGDRDEFAINFDPGWSISYVHRSINSEGAGGQTFVDPKQGYRIVEATFSWLSQSERDGFVESIEMAIVNNGHRDMLWIRDVDSTNLSRDCIWGYQDGEAPIVEPQIVFPQAFSKTYRIRERL